MHKFFQIFFIIGLALLGSWHLHADDQLSLRSESTPATSAADGVSPAVDMTGTWSYSDPGGMTAVAHISGSIDAFGGQTDQFKHANPSVNNAVSTFVTPLKGFRRSDGKIIIQEQDTLGGAVIRTCDLVDGKRLNCQAELNGRTYTGVYELSSAAAVAVVSDQGGQKASITLGDIIPMSSAEPVSGLQEVRLRLYTQGDMNMLPQLESLKKNGSADKEVQLASHVNNLFGAIANKTNSAVPSQQELEMQLRNAGMEEKRCSECAKYLQDSSNALRRHLMAQTIAAAFAQQEQNIVARPSPARLYLPAIQNIKKSALAVSEENKLVLSKNIESFSADAKQEAEEKARLEAEEKKSAAVGKGLFNMGMKILMSGGQISTQDVVQSGLQEAVSVSAQIDQINTELHSRISSISVPGIDMSMFNLDMDFGEVNAAEFHNVMGDPVSLASRFFGDGK